MSDRFALPLLALLALGLIALALVWPQGLGRRSPGPFGHAPAAHPAVTKPPPSSPSLRGELPAAAP